MAKYNRVEEPVRKAKEFNNISETKKISLENTLKSYDKERNRNKLYNEGYSWFMSNKAIEDDVDEIVVDGQTVKRNETIYFQRGYQAAAKQKGMEFGYKGVSLEEIDKKYLDNKYFLDGYKNGLETALANKQKKTK